MRVAVDTNILLRLVVADHSAQAAAADKLARQHHIVISPTALLETEWVLRRVLRLSRDEILGGFERLLGLATATILSRDQVNMAMRAFAGGCDFADALHAASANGVDVFATFDRKFARQAKSLEYLPLVRLLSTDGALIQYPGRRL